MPGGSLGRYPPLLALGSSSGARRMLPLANRAQTSSICSHSAWSPPGRPGKTAEGSSRRHDTHAERAPCSFLLRILTYKRFHSNLAIAPTCDTMSTFHITDNARDPQRGLSRATYLLKVSRRPAEPARRSLAEFCAVHGALRGWFASMPLPCVDDGPRMMALQHFMKTFHLPPRLLRSWGQRSLSRD